MRALHGAETWGALFCRGRQTAHCGKSKGAVEVWGEGHWQRGLRGLRGSSDRPGNQWCCSGTQQILWPWRYCLEDQKMGHTMGEGQQAVNYINIGLTETYVICQMTCSSHCQWTGTWACRWLQQCRDRPRASVSDQWEVTDTPDWWHSSCGDDHLQRDKNTRTVTKTKEWRKKNSSLIAKNACHILVPQCYTPGWLRLNTSVRRDGECWDSRARSCNAKYWNLQEEGEVALLNFIQKGQKIKNH